MPLTKRMWKCLTLVACALAFIALGTWVNATPKNNAPIPDFVNWATSQAPASAEVMLALDGTQDPNNSTVISAGELAQLNQVLSLLEEVLAVPLLPDGGLQAADVDWLGGQMAVFGSFDPSDAHFSGALIASVGDMSRAKNKLKDKPIAQFSYFDKNWVCLATSEQALQMALDGSKPSLGQSARFKKACNLLSHRRHGLVYLDLAALAPRALASLQVRLGEDKGQEPQLNLASLQALASSLQCLVGGEDIVNNRVLADLYLCADVQNSGSLGRAIFDRSANIDHPTFAERSTQSQFCAASNVRYGYNVLYDFLAIHPLTAFFRDYPDVLLEQRGLSLKKDILEGTLQGSMVSSVAGLDVIKLLDLLAKDADKVLVSQEKTPTTQDKTPTTQGKSALSEDQTPADEQQESFDLGALLDGCLAVWQQADWRVSLALQKGALEKLAARDESLRTFLDGVLHKENASDASLALAQRFAYLPSMRVANNTLWVAGTLEKCAPPAQGEARLGQKTALQTLDEMCGTERCACQWAMDMQAWSKALDNWASSSPDGAGAELSSMLNGRGSWQCGRIMVVPEGLRVCEVVDLGNSPQVR